MTPLDLSSTEVQVRFCPAGAPTIDVWRKFQSMPIRGETLSHDSRTYVVVEIWWGEDGDDGQEPMVIAHEAGRPRAQEALR